MCEKERRYLSFFLWILEIYKHPVITKVSPECNRENFFLKKMECNPLTNYRRNWLKCLDLLPKISLPEKYSLIFHPG